MSIIGPCGKRHFAFSYQYDAGLCYEDNLNIFLSRGGYDAKVKQKSYYAIAVVFADHAQSYFASQLNPSAYIPSAADTDKTNKIIGSIFKKHVTYTTTSNSVRAAASFGIIPASSDYFGISYVFLGSYISAFNVSHHGTVNADISSLIIDDRSLGAIAQRRMDDETISTILSRVVNVMHCAHGASSVVLDSDIYDFNADIVSQICRGFASAGVLAPTIIASSDQSSIIQASAAKTALSKFIRTMIKASDED
jgi:hypothetical protein